MSSDKTRPSSGPHRGELVRQRVIDAAERLLRTGKPDFSMRDLASEAGVSFATPFNQFGNKTAIMHALSTRRIDAMTRRFAEITHPPDAIARVLLAIDTAVAVMLEEPAVSRSFMSWIGTAGPTPGLALARSTDLWALALGDGEGLTDTHRAEALRTLPRQLALGFRGVLSFWTAGELPDEALGEDAREVARSLLRGFADRPISDEVD